MSKLKETKRPNRTSDEDQSDKRENDGRSSLDRLADLTRQILRVPKDHDNRRPS